MDIPDPWDGEPLVGRNKLASAARRELLEVMTGVAESGLGPMDQTPSIGCPIKWRS